MTIDVAERFGRNLVRERSRLGLSQDELAFLADLHRTEIGMLERGVRLCRVDTLVKLSGALGITPNELLTGLTWDPPEISSGRWADPPG